MSEERLSARVWLDCNYSQIGLAMSRSLGDHVVKSVGVIATPVVTECKLKDNDAFAESGGHLLIWSS